MEAPSAPLFVEATDDWGLQFVHQAGAVEDYPAEAVMGSGLALFDCDGDLDLDLFLVQGTASAPHQLYLQEAGRFVRQVGDFEGERSGYGMGVAVGDIDRDGDSDLYVTQVGEDRLYRNDGACGFEDVTVWAGVAVDGWSSSAAFCDLDADGWLDLYVARDVVLDRARECRDSTGRVEFCGPESFADAQDVVLRNRGGGRFEDATEAFGVSARTGSGLGVLCHDLDADGRTDVYVANDADPNQLWIQQDDGTLVDQAVVLGVAVNGQGSPEAGMGVVAEDLDGDGTLDLFLTHLEDESNTLYRNLGRDLGWDDATSALGLAAPSVRWTGFGVVAADFDLDGWRDLAIANGKVKRGRSVPNGLPAPWNDYAEPNLLFRGGPGGFVLATTAGGAFAESIELSRGLVAGDLDRDGDLDLVVTNVNGPARIYRTDSPSNHRWLVVDPVDSGAAGTVLGARVEVVAKTGPATRRRWLGVTTTGGSYLSSRPGALHFGLGEASRVESIQVTWPDGFRESFPGGAVSEFRRLERGAGDPV